MIKDIRIKHKCTQAKLAQKLRVSQQCVASWETGRSKPRAELLPKIAEILGCTIDDLFR